MIGPGSLSTFTGHVKRWAGVDKRTVFNRYYLFKSYYFLALGLDQIQRVMPKRKFTAVTNWGFSRLIKKKTVDILDIPEKMFRIPTVVQNGAV